MNSPKTRKTPRTNDDLLAQLKRLDLLVTAQGLDDLLARASTQRWSPRQLLEEVARSETADLARRSLERRPLKLVSAASSPSPTSIGIGPRKSTVP